MPHVVLLGDSIFDNGASTNGGPDVVAQLRGVLPPSWLASLAAVDGHTIIEIPHQLTDVPAGATHLALSVGGNDALRCLPVLDAPMKDVRQAMTMLGAVTEQFESQYVPAIRACLRLGLPMVCTIYNGHFGDVVFRRVATVFVAFFNDVILRTAAARRSLIRSAWIHRRTPMSTRLIPALTIAALVLSAVGVAALAPGKADDLGFAPDRMPRIREAVQRHVDAGELSGAVTLVVRRGKIAHFEAYGLQDLESKKPMPKDGLFRLASMSKPITAVAVMMMVEEGKIRLTDPVSRFIPEFKGAKVAMPKPGARAGGPVPEFDVVSASRDITIRDLLTHGSGLMSGGLGNAVAPQRGPNDTLATYIPKLGAVPLDFQPGTLWRYSGTAGFDVLSRIVEIVSAQPFDRFLEQRLLDPLGMKDTGFYVRPDNQARLVTLYQRGPDGRLTRAANQDGLSSKTYFAGSGGLVTTAEDYAQFAQMLLNGGELNGRRYLGTRTVQLMSTNHTGDMVNGQFGRPAAGMGFGLGVQIVEDPAAAGLRQSKGSWGWAGAYGTNVTIEPAEKMVTIIMMQTSTGALQRDFENAVFQAIVD